MSIAISGVITGAPQTGLTGPTYTLTADNQPDVNAKQAAVTSVGGTQTGVTTHSVSSPFLLSVWKPKVMAMLGKANPVTGLINNVGKNEYKVITLKGVTPALGQPPQKLIVRTTIEVPAGADSYDPANVRAALSAHIGLVWAQAAGTGDTAVSGLI